MYGVINKKGCKKDVKKSKTDEPEVKPCPKCGEDFVRIHAYDFSPFSLRSGPKPWTERKDDNF
ncbi:MAG: hypothetical protein ABIJ37_09945 [Pseudomonadota bacterium]